MQREIERVRDDAEREPDQQIAADDERQQLHPVTPRGDQALEAAEQRQRRRQHHRDRHQRPAGHVDAGLQHAGEADAADLDDARFAVMEVAAVRRPLPDP